MNKLSSLQVVGQRRECIEHHPLVVRCFLLLSVRIPLPKVTQRLRIADQHELLPSPRQSDVESLVVSQKPYAMVEIAADK